MRTDRQADGHDEVLVAFINSSISSKNDVKKFRISNFGLKLANALKILKIQWKLIFFKL